MHVLRAERRQVDMVEVLCNMKVNDEPYDRGTILQQEVMDRVAPRSAELRTHLPSAVHGPAVTSKAAGATGARVPAETGAAVASGTARRHADPHY